MSYMASIAHSVYIFFVKSIKHWHRHCAHKYILADHSTAAVELATKKLIFYLMQSLSQPSALLRRDVTG